MKNTKRGFPEGFVWGAATSSYQIEGAWDTDGKGLSVWDNFCQQKNAVRGGDTGKVACEHYHRFREDVALMRQMNLDAYRFSISWPRVFPSGFGESNQVGLDFYDALVDALLDANIEPWVTLFHWDYPQALQERGGWLNPESPQWFAEYVRSVVERLSDRVRHWITLNEPQCFLRFGHGDGKNAPGLKLRLEDQLLACHNSLLAHGLAVSTIREAASKNPQVGWAPVAVVYVPASDSEADLVAAEMAMKNVPADLLWSNTWFNDPVFLGSYPEEGLKAFGQAVPKYTSREMEIISAPVDFLGLNIYTGTHVQADQSTGYRELAPPPGHPRSAFDWPVLPESLYWGPRFHWQRYNTPIYITENGLANIDWIDVNGKVLDPQRIDYTRRHLLELRRCCDDAVDVRGYFHWSLLDNFEWAEGYSKRFGLIHVDFLSQQRSLKQSADWYREVISTNGECLDSHR